MIQTSIDTIDGDILLEGFGDNRCHWGHSVCVDQPTHYVNWIQGGGAGCRNALQPPLRAQAGPPMSGAPQDV